MIYRFGLWKSFRNGVKIYNVNSEKTHQQSTGALMILKVPNI